MRHNQKLCFVDLAAKLPSQTLQLPTTQKKIIQLYREFQKRPPKEFLGCFRFPIQDPEDPFNELILEDRSAILKDMCFPV